MRKILLAALLLLPGLAEAAITYVGAGTASNAVDGGIVTPSVHASTTTGDLIVCAVGQRNGTDYTILTSTGYTQLYGRNGTLGRSAIVLLGKIATGTDTVSVDSTDNTAGRTVISQCATFRGTLNTVTGIVDASAGTDNTTQTNVDTPALTVVAANSVVLIVGLRENHFAAEDIPLLSGMDAEIGQPERTSSATVGMVWDYDIQTTASNKSASSWTITGNTTEAVSIALNLKEALAAPTWSVSPTVSAQDTNDYTLSYTPSTSATFYAVACKKDETAPTSAQVKAGNCTGDAAAIASANEAVIGADTTVLGGALTRPVHDLYAVLNNAAGDSTLATLADEMLDAPTGYQYDLLASVGSTSPCAELNPSITPDIAAADVTKWSSTVSPSGDTLTAGTDCEISYPDPVGNWRSATLSIYDTSAGDWMSGGPTTVYFNYPDPTCSVSGCELVVDQVVNGGAFTAIDVCAMFTDPAGGALTCTSSDTGTGTGADKRPAGTTVTSGVFDDTGAGPSSTGNTEGTFSVTATNVAGGTASINVNWFVYDQVNIPDCVGLSLTACGLLLDALNLDPVVTLVYDAGRQIGYVVSQGQAAGTEVDPFTEMDLTVSLGAGPSGRRRRTPGLGVGVGRFVPGIDFDSEWWRGSYGQ